MKTNNEIVKETIEFIRGIPSVQDCSIEQRVSSLAKKSWTIYITLIGDVYMIIYGDTLVDAVEKMHTEIPNKEWYDYE